MPGPKRDFTDTFVLIDLEHAGGWAGLVLQSWRLTVHSHPCLVAPVPAASIDRPCCNAGEGTACFALPYPQLLCPHPIGPAESQQDCRQPPFPLATWPHAAILDPADGRYTFASDLCLVAHCLMSDLPFSLSSGGEDLRRVLAARELDAESALAHEWLAHAPRDEQAP